MVIPLTHDTDRETKIIIILLIKQDEEESGTSHKQVVLQWQS